MEQQKRKTEPRPAPGQGQERVGAPTFEGPALQAGAASSAGRISLTVSPKSLKRMKDRVRLLTKRNRPIPFDKRVKALNDFLRGWINYYQLARCKKHMEDLGGWMRRKLRCVKLKEWKRAYTIARNLMSLGIEAEDAWKLAGSGKG